MTAVDHRRDLPELLRTRLPFDDAGPATARRALAAVSDRLGTSAGDAELLVSELVTNAILHGRELGDAAGGLVLQVLAIDGGHRVQVLGGSGDAHPHMVVGPLEAMPSGRGLRLVDRLATGWGFMWDRQRTTAWFDFGGDSAKGTTTAQLVADAHEAMGRSSNGDAVTGVLAALGRLSASDRCEYWSTGEGGPRLEVVVEDHAGGRGVEAAQDDLGALVAAAQAGPLARPAGGGALLAAAPVRSRGTVVGVIALRTLRGDGDEVGTILRSVAAQLGRFVVGGPTEDGRAAVLSELAFLSEASRVLASSLDYDRTLQQVARLVVPARADWCTINVVEGDRTIRRVAVEHANPKVLPRLEEMLDSYPHDPDAGTGVPLVIRTGEALLFEEVPASLLEETAHDSEYLSLTRELSISSCIIVPLEARGRVVGTMSVISTDHRRLRFGEADLAVALDLGRRAGMAIDNARLYTERAYLATALQRLLLPESLPEIVGLELAAEYVPARDTTDVGGDFYDVVGGPAGEWYFVVGDVQGKGPDAATLIGLARHTVRTAAMRGDSRARP